MKFLQNDVVHGHPEGRIHSGMNRDPPVGVARYFAEIGRQHDQLRSVVARLGDEVHVGSARHVEVAAGGYDVLAVVPVGAFGDVGLFSPRLRRCRRKVRIEIVETQQRSPEQLKKAGAGRIAEHRHSGNRREAGHPVRPVFLRGV